MLIRALFKRILRDKLNTSVIVVSLAVGIACANLIGFFIVSELNTDSFHKNGDRIYLLSCDNPFEKGTQINVCRAGAAEYMKANIPQIEDFCRIKRVNVQKVIVDNQEFTESPEVFETSANFFKFFSFSLAGTNPESVFKAKNDIVISEELASKYFGNLPAVGKIITLARSGVKTNYLIKGLFRKPIEKSQLSFDIVKYADNTEGFAFVLLKKNTNPTDVEKIFAAGKDKIPVIHDGTPGKYYLKNFRQAYFNQSPDGSIGIVRDKADLWIAFIIGLMIIGVAAVNFLGLINNKLMDKAKDFSVRRINGGSKASLVADFMLENVILIFTAFLLSLGLMTLMLPFFNKLVDSEIVPGYFFQMQNLIVMFGILGFLLSIALLFSLAKIRLTINSSVLRGKTILQGKIIRVPAFNIFQIAVSVILIVCSGVITKQIRYIANKDIGINKDVIEVKLPYQYADITGVFKDEILKNPAISTVSVTTASPLLEYWMVSFHYAENGADKQYSPAIFNGDENFIKTLGIKVIEGRDFSDNTASNENKCLVNESLAAKFKGQNLVGGLLPGDDKLIVIGVVKDFHFNSLKNKIDAGIIRFNKEGNHLLVQGSKNDNAAVAKAISGVWQKLIPDYPLNIESVKDRFDWYHRENANYVKLIVSCCVISLFLSMIGLFAISLHATRKRTKEIGIRKINGAQVSEVMAMLNSDFVKWVIIAFLFATPVAYYAMHKWLQNFAYKTELSWWIFALAGMLALGIALLTVSWQSWRAAKRNPVEALKYE